MFQSKLTQFKQKLIDMNINNSETHEHEVINVIALTHQSCHDGAGSAWVIDNYFRNLNKTQNKIQYHIQHYRVDPRKADLFVDKLIENKSDDTTNTLVFSADVAYRGEVMEKLIELYPNIVILDHHISTYQDTLQHYYFKYLEKHNDITIAGELIEPNEKKIIKEFLSSISDNLASTSEFIKYLPSNFHFNNNESGATMTWKHFHNDKDIPLTLQYIKDRDLFSWDNPKVHSLPNAEILTLGLYEILTNNPPKHDWTIWDEFIQNETKELEKALEVGNILHNELNKLVWRAYKSVVPFEVLWEGKIWKGASVNVSNNISDVGNFIVRRKEKETNNYIYDFCLIWKYTSDCRFSCSLRSRKSQTTSDEFNCSSFAQYFGGGGHQPASAFTLDNVFNLINKTFDISDQYHKISAVKPFDADDETDFDDTETIFDD